MFCGRLSFLISSPETLISYFSLAVVGVVSRVLSLVLGRVMVSPEDVAWADSCLSRDPEIIDSDWDSLKDALLETLNAQNHSSPYERELLDKAPVSIATISEGAGTNYDDRLNHENTDDFWSSHKMEDVFRPTYNENSREVGVSDQEVDLLLQEFQLEQSTEDSDWTSLKDALLKTLDSPYETENSREGAKMETFSREDVHKSDKAPISDIAETNDNDRLNHEDADDFWSSHKMEDVFRPTYNENSRDVGVSDPGVDSYVQEFRLEQPAEDIFKIWEFDIPREEETELIKELNKALKESSLEPITSVPDDSEASKGLLDESIYDIISGIADLSLRTNSG